MAYTTTIVVAQRIKSRMVFVSGEVEESYRCWDGVVQWVNVGMHKLISEI